jgi:hypothetical protein
MSTLPATSSVNFKDAYFIHTSLTKITGEPTYHTCSVIYQQLKANIALDLMSSSRVIILFAQQETNHDLNKQMYL